MIKNSKNFISIPLLLLCAVILATGWFFYETHSLNHAAPFSRILVERQKKRFEASQMGKICRTLGVKKNMVILDIGAGSGQYAYGFAQALQGTGEVFATDIDPQMVNYEKTEVQKKQLKNLTSVLVKAEGVDDFYARHRYDLIFIAHTLPLIQDYRGFLRKMKQYLTPQGHLVILKYKFLGSFRPKDFTDVNGLLKQIVKERPDSPFYKYVRPLQPQAKRILAGEALNQTFLSQIVRYFNDMAHDGHFFVPFLDRKDMVLKDNLGVSAQERVFIDFNLSYFKEFNVLDEKGGVDLQSPFLPRFCHGLMVTINQALILSEFKDFMYRGRSPLLPGGDVNWQIEANKKDFESFGYGLLQSYDFIPGEILMEFSPQD